MSAYSRNTEEVKDSFEEIAVPQCKSTIHSSDTFTYPSSSRSSSWVSLRQRPRPSLPRQYVPSLDSAILELTSPLELLADSPFIEDLDHIIRCFDKTTKLRFRNIDGPQYIKFGSTRDNDEAHGIRFGQLKLQGCVLVMPCICYSC